MREYAKYKYSFDDFGLFDRLKNSQSVDSVDEVVLSLIKERLFSLRDFAILLGLDPKSGKDLLPWSTFVKLIDGRKAQADALIDQMVDEVDNDPNFKTWFRLGILDYDELSRYYLMPRCSMEFILSKAFGDEYKTLRRQTSGRRRPKPFEDVTVEESIANADKFTQESFSQMIANQVMLPEVCRIFKADFEILRDKIMTFNIPAVVDVRISDDVIDVMKDGMSVEDARKLYVCTSEQMRDIRKKFGCDSSSTAKIISKRLRESLASQTYLDVEFDLDDQLRNRLSRDDRLLIAAKMISSGYWMNDVVERTGLLKEEILGYCEKFNYASKISSDRRKIIEDKWFDYLTTSNEHLKLLRLYSENKLSKGELEKAYKIPTYLYQRKFKRMLDSAGCKSVSQIVGQRRGRIRTVQSCIELASNVDPELFSNVIERHLDVNATCESGAWLSTVRRREVTHELVELMSEYKSWNGDRDVYPDSRIFTALGIDESYDVVCKLEQMSLLRVDYTRLRESRFESDFRSVLDSWGVDYKVNDRDALNGLEIDFWIPGKNIGIELSPNQTHHSNEWFRYRPQFHPKPKDYHFKKYQAATASGVELIQLYSSQIDSHSYDKTLAWLKTKLGLDVVKVYARNCSIVEAVTRDDVKQIELFINENHLQGYKRSKHKFKIIDKSTNEMVGAFTVSKVNARSSKKYTEFIELTRFCVKAGYVIVGCTSKVVSFIERRFEDEYAGLISYSDNNIGSGVSYEKAGMTFDGETGPSRIYVSRSDSKDTHSWQINSTWGAISESGVVGSDRFNKGLTNYKDDPFDIEKYIELELSHRSDGGEGYDLVCTAGSKRWTKLFED